MVRQRAGEGATCYGRAGGVIPGILVRIPVESVVVAVLLRLFFLSSSVSSRAASGDGSFAIRVFLVIRVGIMTVVAALQ